MLINNYYEEFLQLTMFVEQLYGASILKDKVVEIKTLTKDKESETLFEGSYILSNGSHIHYIIQPIKNVGMYLMVCEEIDLQKKIKESELQNMFFYPFEVDVREKLFD